MPLTPVLNFSQNNIPMGAVVHRPFLSFGNAKDKGKGDELSLNSHRRSIGLFKKLFLSLPILGTILVASQQAQAQVNLVPAGAPPAKKVVLLSNTTGTEDGTIEQTTVGIVGLGHNDAVLLIVPDAKEPKLALAYKKLLNLPAEFKLTTFTLGNVNNKKGMAQVLASREVPKTKTDISVGVKVKGDKFFTTNQSVSLASLVQQPIPKVGTTLTMEYEGDQKKPVRLGVIQKLTNWLKVGVYGKPNSKEVTAQAIVNLN
jgi:hypothetical protein